MSSELEPPLWGSPHFPPHLHRERRVKAADLQPHRSHRRPASTAVFVPEVPAPEVPAQKRRYRKLGGLGAHCCRRTCCGSTCLPVSADLSGGAERKCRKKRRWRRRQRLRQFSDLWVRLEKSAAVPQLQVPILDGHISAELRLPRCGRWWPALPVGLSGPLCSGCWCWPSKQRHPSCNRQDPDPWDLKDSRACTPHSGLALGPAQGERLRGKASVGYSSSKE
ncbi:metalloprotease TIKI1 isoform X3 [Camelus dromedarius]|uniref:metalloprotease TIKI1 isoform X3 n=1 Tax=Camelus dromedarius TaxID=9838 RepID=UPI00311919F4